MTQGRAQQETVTPEKREWESPTIRDWDVREETLVSFTGNGEDFGVYS